jgi:hypothetical protein
MSKKHIKAILLSLAAAVIVMVAFIVVKDDSPGSGSISENEAQTALEGQVSQEGTDAISNSKVDVISRDDNIQSSGDSGLNQIEPVIVFAVINEDYLDISSYVPVVESNGKCVAVLSHATTEVFQKDVDSTPSASTTQCALIRIPISSLASGDYDLVVKYASNQSEGVSQMGEVTIP